MTETEVTSTEPTETSNDTVVASQNDTVASGAGDTVVSGEADAKPTNEFSWNDFVAQLEAEDKKVANVAKMYSNPKDTVKALYEANKKISQGFKEPELPKNANEEQIKEYRQKIGVPESPDKYQFPETVKVKEEDKPLWDLFGKFAIENNISQKDFGKLAPAYYAMEAAIREQGEADYKTVVREQDAAIKEMWGSDAEINMKANEEFLKNSGGETLAQLLLGATSSDGKPLGNNPTVVKWLNEQARAFGYADVMTAGKSGGTGIDDEINEILERKRTPNYYHRKNQAQVNKDQARFLELIAIKEKLKK